MAGIITFISPYFLIGYGILILVVTTIYQIYERQKLRFIFNYPDHELTRLYVTNHPKLIYKLHLKYGASLTEKHSNLISLKNDSE